MNKEDYKCWLYRQVDGKTDSRIFTGETAVKEAVETGEWFTTFADFLDTAEGVEGLDVEALKDVCAIAAGDRNIIANADQIKDLDKIKEAYERATGKTMRATTLKGARKTCKLAIGEQDGNSSNVH